MGTPRQEFMKRNGGVEQMVFVSPGRVMFMNGAYMESSPNGLQIEPPDDAHELAKDKVRFHQARLDLATEEFVKLKQQLVSFTNTVLSDGSDNPGASQESIVRLKGLQLKVKNYRRNLDRVQGKLEKLGDDSEQGEIEHYEKLHTENSQRNQAILSELQGIRV